MDLSYSQQAEAFREEIRRFLSDSLPADWEGIGALDADEAHAFTEKWRHVLRDHGYLASQWPTEYGGGGLTPLESVVLAQECASRGVPRGGPHDGFGIGMLGNTMLQLGTEEQKQYYLPRIIAGEDRWCQGYSEPAAGSDLGNLGCRAVLDGDEWIINGQKVWTSGGLTANRIFVLARTDPAAPKHRGISFLLVDMDQPGVEVRPIKMLSGDAEFCETFFVDARCPAENVLGEVNGGWAVAMTLLGHERGASAAVTSLGFREELDRLLELAADRGLTDDPDIRQRLARAHTKVEILRWQGYRALTRFLKGQAPGPESSIGKLLWSHHHQAVSELAVDILGADAMAPVGQPPHSVFPGDSRGAPNDSAAWVGTFYAARAGTIYAGTSEVQRGIVGEQVLGLPKEPRADAGPWNEIPGHG